MMLMMTRIFFSLINENDNLEFEINIYDYDDNEDSLGCQKMVIKMITRNHKKI